jgi:hypothetical protein
MGNSTTQQGQKPEGEPTGLPPSAHNEAKEADRRQAAEEGRQPSASQPGGFTNDPDDPTNPNEVIERHRRQLRP